MNNLHLEQPGSKNLTLRGRNLIIKWHVWSKGSTSSENDVTYEGLITIEYKDNGKNKSKDFNSKSSDKDETWSTLVSDIDDFLKSLDDKK